MRWLANAALVALAVNLCTCERTPKPTGVPVLAMRPSEDADCLMLRATSDGRGDLLLRCLTYAERLASEGRGPAPTSVPGASLPVYRYTPGSDHLEVLATGAWDEAPTEVCQCEVQDLASIAPLELKSHALRFQDRVVTTAGQHVIQAVASPSGRYVAVLSGAGRLHVQQDLVFGSGVWATGQYFVEILDRLSAAAVGPAVPVQVTTQRATRYLCWSCDERYVLSVHCFFVNVCIVETKLSEGNQP